ncbi:MAG: Ig-like domain-containing protein [Butyricicoccus pullicaecorum]|nr:Ig-like domain-containing protein [Butyricicoccus pullicaecorum]
MEKRVVKSVAAVMFLFCFCMPSALAHGGRTDANGGHRDNQNVSGLGAYHYHHGYEAHLHPEGICPYAHDELDKGAVQPEVHASSITVGGIPQKAVVSQPFQLEASVFPSDAQEREISWSSSDPSVATVTEDGEVMPLRAGTVEICAKTANDIVEVVTLTIAEIPVAAVSIQFDEDMLEKGKLNMDTALQMRAVVQPKERADSAVHWSVSDTEIAEISENGLLVPRRSGTVTVTAYCQNGIQDSVALEIQQEKNGFAAASVVGLAALGGWLLYRRKTHK